MTKITPDFIWDMRVKLREASRIWSEFPQKATDTQYSHYNNVRSLLDILERSVELANQELIKEENRD